MPAQGAFKKYSGLTRGKRWAGVGGGSILNNVCIYTATLSIILYKQSKSLATTNPHTAYIASILWQWQLGWGWGIYPQSYVYLIVNHSKTLPHSHFVHTRTHTHTHMHTDKLGFEHS